MHRNNGNGAIKVVLAIAAIAVAGLALTACGASNADRGYSDSAPSSAPANRPVRRGS